MTQHTFIRIAQMQQLFPEIAPFNPTLIFSFLHLSLMLSAAMDSPTVSTTPTQAKNLIRSMVSFFAVVMSVPPPVETVSILLPRMLLNFVLFKKIL
ncbi:hypothetical protein Patl1_10923 [Pistacia atlantica]|uniref:Uncharacterized protein n=1 Tax=Pistacia atlantica TaxID=434234 RepID=A0ACC1A2S3_9ROSI|nr:hypothetical protein Patl1_10923 [Pistacia atlantica]